MSKALIELKPEHVTFLTGLAELERVCREKKIIAPGSDALGILESDDLPGLQELVAAGLLRARPNYLSKDRAFYGIPEDEKMSEYSYCLTPEGRRIVIATTQDAGVALWPG